MKSNLLPFYKTGWLYLLVVLWCGLFWSSQQGYFDSVNQWNRDLLFDLTERKAAPSDSKSAHLIRINSDWQNTDSDLLVKLLKQNSEADVLLIGQASDKELARLNQHLANSIRKGSVIVGVDDPYLTKNIQYKTQLPEWLFNFINQFRTFDIEEKFQRQFSDLLLLSLSNQKKSAIFSRNDYLLNGEISLLGLLSENQKNIQSNYIDANWNLNLNLGQTYWSLGFLGQLYYPKVDEKKQNDFSIDNYLQSLESKKIKSEFIIIHDGSYSNIDQVESNLKTLFNKEYRYQSLLMIIFQLVFLAFGLYILWYIKKYRKLILFVGSLSLFASLLVFQYISFTQMQWFAAFPIALSWLATLGLIFAYQNEIHAIEKIQAKHNELLAHAVSIFYETQNFDKIQPLLIQTNPDLTLVEKVFDVALQAESKNNLPLTKKLLTWIQESGVKHRSSQLLLEELTQPKQPSEEAGLDSTMVIEPGTSISQSMTALNFNIEQFGRYKVEGILGKGAMGIVYQGVDPKINRHVAIKTLQLSDDVEDEGLVEVKERFFREAETAGNLSHANIVTIYDVGEEGHLGYIAMDLLTGAPLSSFTKPENKLPTPLVYQLMIQITDALDYAHQQNVVHRDIKPGNIIFDDDLQRVSITDFGIAFVADNSKTRTGTIMGSPYYMSPEQVLGERVDGRSDVFSLGVTFYQLLSGHLPFNGESIATVAYHITKTKQKSVRHWDSKLPASAARITNKALQKDVSKRYQTMDEFKQVLINALKRDFKKTPII